MTEIKPIVLFSAISGFVHPRNMGEVLRLYIKRAGVVPPVFVFVKDDIMTGRTGFYASFRAQMDDKELEAFGVLMDDFVYE